MIEVDGAVCFGCSCFVLQSEDCTQDSMMTKLKHSAWTSRKLRACASSTGRKQRRQVGVIPCSEASKPAPVTHFIRTCDPNLLQYWNKDPIKCYLTLTGKCLPGAQTSLIDTR